MVFNIIILTFVILLAIAMIFIYIKIPKQVVSKKTVFDDTKDYLHVVNSFVRNEFLFELKKWIMQSKSVTNVANGENKFYTELTDDEILQQKLSKITALIITKMSSDVKNAFYRLYSTSFSYYGSEDDEPTTDKDTLYIYVARLLALYVSRIVTELTTLMTKFSDISQSEIMSDYIIEINNELYISNETYIINLNTVDENNFTQKTQNMS